MGPAFSCQHCGTRLTDRAPAGLCPRCLMESALRLVVEGESVNSVKTPEKANNHFPAPAPFLESGPNSVLGRMGNYELIDRIASGGMGVVYRARQLGLNRIVAVKALPFGPFTREEFVQRFQLEASAAAKLRHPNIVTIFEVGRADGYPFFSMEFIEGNTLAELVRDQPLPSDRAARLVRTIAEAVHYAHQQGILHRDLKPSNVLIDALDQPHITDFGLARDLGEPGDLTVTGQAFGSPNFMPPEQAEGRHADVSPRSDVYGLGAILYHLTTGRPPFTAPSAMSVLRQVVQNEPPHPRVLNPSLSHDLETICLKCLEKEPAHRYATAQELADELGRFQRNEPILARPLGPVSRAWRWCRRRPAVAALLAVLCFVLATGFITTLGQWRRAEQAAARLAENVTRLEIDRAEDRLERGETSEGLAQLARVLRRDPTNTVAAKRIIAVLNQRRFLLPQPAVIQDDFVGRNSAFTQHGPWLVTATNRGSTLQLWDTRQGPILRCLMPCGEPIRVAAFRRDGQAVIAASASGTLLVFHIPVNELPKEEPSAGTTTLGGKRDSFIPHQLRPTAGPFKLNSYIDRVLLSPDGSQAIAHISGPNSDDWKRARLTVLDVTTGRVLREETHLHWAAFSPNGKWLVTVSNRTAQLRHPVTWEALGPPLQHRARINTAEFSPDSSLVVTASADKTARLWQSETGEPVGSPMRRELQVLSAFFSPDGSRVLTKDLGRHAQLWNGTNALPVGPLLQQSRGIVADSFSRDGKLVLTYSGSKIWLSEIAAGNPITEPLDVGHVVPRARFLGTGRQLMISSFGGQARIWEAPAANATGGVLSHQGEVNAVAVSPDGSLVAAATADGQAAIWKAATGEFVTSLNHDGQVLRIAFDSAGRRVVTASTDRTARLWELPSGQPLGEPLRHTRTVFHAGFSPDGRWLVTCAEDSMARFWNGHTLAHVGAPMPHKGDVRATAFRPDGKILATAATDGTVSFWSVPEGMLLGERLRHSNTVSGIAFSPDGQVLASCGSEKGARLWRLPQSLERFRGAKQDEVPCLFLPHEGHVTSVQFDSAGARVVTASDDSTARLWNVENGAALARPLRHRDRVVFASFSADGRHVLTASNDGTGRIWDSSSGHPVTDPLRHEGIVTSTQWSPHGDYVVTGSYDRTVRLWPVPFLSTAAIPAWLPDLAEAIGGKRLIDDYLHAPVKPAEFLEFRAALLSGELVCADHPWVERLLATPVFDPIPQAESTKPPPMGY